MRTETKEINRKVNCTESKQMLQRKPHGKQKQKPNLKIKNNEEKVNLLLYA